jgi:glucose-1-phosphatase
MPAPRLVLFDMDDVLCHYDWPGRVAALARLAGLAGDAYPDDVWDADLEDRADRGEIDAAEYLARFGSRLGLSLNRAQWVENRRAAMTPWPDMLALAKAISERATIAILSNNGHLTGECIDALFPELRPIFGERITMSARLGAQKPDPEVYHRALALFGFSAQETLFTDDRAENVDGAIAAGLMGHVHAGPDTLRTRLAELGLPIST